MVLGLDRQFGLVWYVAELRDGRVGERDLVVAYQLRRQQQYFEIRHPRARAHPCTRSNGWSTTSATVPLRAFTCACDPVSHMHRIQTLLPVELREAQRNQATQQHLLASHSRKVSWAAWFAWRRQLRLDAGDAPRAAQCAGMGATASD
eukprot:m.341028 g.341028  ORF g.341028 m.341028 type:complete len:148 (+) comp20603_c0_seq24:2378-2821(+)